LHRGTLFLWLFVVLAPGVTLLLLGLGVRRVLRESVSRRRILAAVSGALGLWAAATYFMFHVVFATAWGVAHMRPFPGGIFPEGWPIYGFLAAYTTLAAILGIAVRKLPKPTLP
jgi:hypothetical protein